MGVSHKLQKTARSTISTKEGKYFMMIPLFLMGRPLMGHLQMEING